LFEQELDGGLQYRGARAFAARAAPSPFRVVKGTANPSGSVVEMATLMSALADGPEAVIDLSGLRDLGAVPELAVARPFAPHTVNPHRRDVFAKLGVNSRVELARLAAERQEQT
jgi:regulatory LuxR family protein